MHQDKRRRSRPRLATVLLIELKNFLRPNPHTIDEIADRHERLATASDLRRLERAR